ncbi:hypothetical protein PENTCL1PPCAC_2793, partial [Pristionchus entomophagus]
MTTLDGLIGSTHKARYLVEKKEITAREMMYLLSFLAKAEPEKMSLYYDRFIGPFKEILSYGSHRIISFIISCLFHMGNAVGSKRFSLDAHDVRSFL